MSLPKSPIPKREFSSRLLMFIGSAFCCLLMHSSLAETQASISQAVEQELEELGSIYVVKAPNRDLATRAAITFHSNLLETHSDKSSHVMTLSDLEVEQLQDFGFIIKPAKDWKTKYREQRARQIIEIENASNTTNDVNISSISGYSCYPTVEETFNTAASLANNNPNIASWTDIGDSWQKSNGLGGYDLMVLKITNQANTADKPILFIHSAMHAREYTTAALTLEFAKQMINSYGTDADYTWIIDHHEVHILFHMNPDGRKQAETGLLWRKNTNQNYCGANSNSRGADLNRNFTYTWNITNGSGSSSNQCNSTYRGPTPASEPETQAVEAYVRSLFPDQRGDGDLDAAPDNTQGMHLDVHSYSELILWPWGHTNAVAPNGTALQTLGRKLAYWNGYAPQQSIGLYATDGTSDSVSYGELGIPNFTYELGTAFFQDCATYENVIKPNNLPSLKYAAKVVSAPYLIPAGPELTNLELNGNSNATVPPGTAVNITATADDTRYENRNGNEPSQNIIEAQYTIDVPPWDSAATPIPLNASDGSFNAASEVVSNTIDTAGLSQGEHIVYVRAKDANGQWGAVSASFLRISNDVVPAAPSNLSATTIKQGKGKKTTIISVDLDWTDNASNEEGFIIERCVETGRGKNKVCDFNQSNQIIVNTPDISTYSDTSPLNGTSKYRVRAFSNIGISSPSNEANAD